MEKVILAYSGGLDTTAVIHMLGQFPAFFSMGMNMALHTGLIGRKMHRRHVGSNS